MTTSILQETVQVQSYINPIGEAHIVTRDGHTLRMFTGAFSEQRAARWAKKYIQADHSPKSYLVQSYNNPIGDAYEVVDQNGTFVRMFTGVFSEWRATRWAEKRNRK